MVSGSTPSTARPPRLSLKLLACAVSVLASLALAEGAATLLHRGAYPYLNLFEPDARYGVRLQANANTRVRSRDGRITEISTNSLGFRGPEWVATPSAQPRVLVLGDSQVFGYGVPFEETMGRKLQRRLGPGAQVFSAGVPSWGPHESSLALADLGPRFRPTQVVFVANAANDWFETVPNLRRTTAEDGWAASPGPHGAAFPFRPFLFGRSHLVLAARQVAKVIGPAELPPAELALRLSRDLGRLRDAHAPYRSPLGAPLAQTVELCRQLSCEVLAVALPLDVQVSRAEWPKYRSEGAPMADSEALLEDFLADASSLGVRGANLLPGLRAAEPGAFLADDYHLSGRGHSVVAAVIASLIQQPQVSR